MENLIRVELLGTSFSIKAPENQEYLEQVIANLRFKLEEIQKKTNIKDSLKLSLLVSLNLVDELLKLKEGLQAGPSLSETSEVDRMTQRMINRIDQILD